MNIHIFFHVARHISNWVEVGGKMAPIRWTGYPSLELMYRQSCFWGGALSSITCSPGSYETTLSMRGAIFSEYSATEIESYSFSLNDKGPFYRPKKETQTIHPTFFRIFGKTNVVWFTLSIWNLNLALENFNRKRKKNRTDLSRDPTVSTHTIMDPCFIRPRDPRSLEISQLKMSPGELISFQFVSWREKWLQTGNLTCMFTLLKFPFNHELAHTNVLKYKVCQFKIGYLRILRRWADGKFNLINLGTAESWEPATGELMFDIFNTHSIANLFIYESQTFRNTTIGITLPD